MMMVKRDKEDMMLGREEEVMTEEREEEVVDIMMTEEREEEVGIMMTEEREEEVVDIMMIGEEDTTMIEEQAIIIRSIIKLKNSTIKKEEAITMIKMLVVDSNKKTCGKSFRR